MKANPDFARFKTAVMCQGEPDQVPIVEFSVDPEIKEAFFGRPVETTKDEVEFWAKAGYDFIPLTVGIRSLFSNESIAAGRGIKDVKQNFSARYSANSSSETTRAWAKEGRGLIGSRTDFDQFVWPDVGQLDFDVLDEVTEYLPPKMKVVAVLGYVFMAVWQLMGLETFCLALFDDRRLVEQMFQRVGDIQLEALKRAIEFRTVGAVFMPDDFAYTEDLIISPSVYRQYVFPYYKEMGRICREKGLPYILHSDGKLDKIMDDILDCGFNAIHPIEPKAMDIRKLKRESGDRLCLIGNLDLGGVLTMGTPEEVREATRKLIRDVGPGGGYCVGSSNSITEYVPLANFNSMREAAFEYGRYPLSSL